MEENMELSRAEDIKKSKKMLIILCVLGALIILLCTFAPMFQATYKRKVTVEESLRILVMSSEELKKLCPTEEAMKELIEDGIITETKNFSVFDSLLLPINNFKNGSNMHPANEIMVLIAFILVNTVALLPTLIIILIVTVKIIKNVKNFNGNPPFEAINYVKDFGIQRTNKKINVANYNEVAYQPIATLAAMNIFFPLILRNYISRNLVSSGTSKIEIYSIVETMFSKYSYFFNLKGGFTFWFVIAVLLGIAFLIIARKKIKLDKTLFPDPEYVNGRVKKKELLTK